ncbi:hypothetical protein B7P43_G09117 [Cryptotermes secundus]|uniref:PiggyBac transposable element-derived protein domain-containing protein n=1 Tax=Cryptotermes secundus TaxID=105785 RepID=A0A2J7Q4C7_9NEOP|nr:hypothetical protein B7P43_G09117 [Cryptotermes secundus]
MIPELNEIDSDNSTVIDNDPQDSNHEHLATTSAVPDTPISWTYGDIVPVIVPFTSSSGIKIDITHKMHPFSWIKFFLDDDLLTHITTETNRYAHQQFNTHELAPHSRELSYKYVASDEIWTYLGIVFMTGIDKRPEIEDYWSTRPLFHTPWYGQKMSLRRFQQISKFLHFADNDARPADCEDRLYKVRPIIDSLVGKFRNTYIPEKEIAIDEGMIAWKGRLIFRVYMPDKPDKYGIKAYLVCESTSGYIWNFEIYCGKSRPIKELVVDLLGPQLLDKGYHLYQDNYYNSVELCETLLQRNTYVCGTFRMDRGAPKELKNDVKKLKKGESVFSRKGQVLVQVWRDKRDVKLISTLHTAKIVESAKTNRKGEKICRPEVIGDYNKHMRGVDRADQMLHYYPCSRKTVKWTKKLVFFLLQMAALNSFILFKKYTTTEKYKKRNYKFKDFILDCVEKMTEQNKQLKDPENRLEGGLKVHKMVHVPPSNNKKNGAMRKCRVCAKHKIRKETSVMCASCGVALCKLSCFNVYHTMKNY